MRAHALTRGGALAALGVGTLTFASGSWAFTLILLAFFVPSVALSRVGRTRKKRLTDIAKGGARDAVQVLANGGVATLCAVAAVYAGRAGRPGTARASQSGTTPSELEVGAHRRSRRASPWVSAFAGAYAAATADTWGTEIGTLVRAAPRSIFTFKPIATGLSGGVTVAGTAAEFAGAGWIALCASAALRANANPPSGETATSEHLARLPETLRFAAAVTGAGVAGAILDSVLGATLQELRHCPACKRTCETNPHSCGTATALVRGIPGFSNDLVNFAATLCGASTAFALRATTCRSNPFRT